MYDQRLFNQDTGVGAGGGAEDSYNIYDKPLFADRAELFKHTVRPGGAGAGVVGRWAGNTAHVQALLLPDLT